MQEFNKMLTIGHLNVNKKVLLICMDRMNRENGCGGKVFGEADHTRDNDELCYAYIAFYFYCHFRVLDLSKIKQRRAAVDVRLKDEPYSCKLYKNVVDVGDDWGQNKP